MFDVNNTGSLCIALGLVTEQHRKSNPSVSFADSAPIRGAVESLP